MPEANLVARRRAGDEAAFEGLITRHYSTMLAVAMTYVKGRAVAEEVVQETWLAVIEGLDRFEGRSSLKTWILSILVNKAKTRGVREARSVAFTALEGSEPALARTGRAVRAAPRLLRRLRVVPRPDAGDDRDRRADRRCRPARRAARPAAGRVPL